MADTTAAAAPAAWNQSSHPEDLEGRVQRLEDVVASLCDTTAMEDRITLRLAERLAQQQAEHAPPARVEHDSHLHSQAADFQASVAQTYLHLSSVPETMGFFGEIWWEIKSLWRMIRDPLYTMSWLTKLIIFLPVAYLLYTMLAGFHSGVLGPFGFLLDVLLFCPFFYVAVKAWGRELRRYREFCLRRGRYATQPW
jgi:hypothetical protein